MLVQLHTNIPQEALLARFSLYVHKSGLKPDSFLHYHWTFRHSRELHQVTCKQADRESAYFNRLKSECGLRFSICAVVV